ncbi:MAG: cryptochrome/photolyase family protein [Candidatus Obscuribacter sp.]|nr:cryptochrome/photolyase family protein [Candidatus Obscuribacter sp.]
MDNLVSKTKFGAQLKKLNKDNSGGSDRQWIYVPYDQVTDRLGPLSRLKPEQVGIILVESPWKAARRPYHKQKLALILSNLRHFALEQAARGVAVRHVSVNGPYHMALKALAQELGPITMMEAAERELREDVSELVKDGALKVIPHEGWLTSLEDLKAIKAKDGTYHMDAFYRRIRQSTGILMEGPNKPRGGKYSFDSENRLPWKGQPSPPVVPTFVVDAITEEVGELIEHHMGHHPGELDLPHLTSTQDDADRLWQWAKDNCMDNFGPYEDAMSSQSSGLFHTRISQPLNIMRLIPRDIVTDVLELDISTASQEGFIRQVIGWREFIHKMHVLTDGYRAVVDKTAISETPSDAGYKRWSGNDFNKQQDAPATKAGTAKSGVVNAKSEAGTAKSETAKDQADPDGGAAPNYLDSNEPLPVAYWGTSSGLNCLDTVVKDVWREAYSHHITRLMILSNIANLMDVNPREITDWFWVAYADAYDWVVEPNVLSMGLFATGNLMTTKPYVSGSAYINKMSDYCKGCQFNPAKNCPITRLYWAFLARKADKLKDNQRLFMPMNSLSKRADKEKQKDQETFKVLSSILAQGKVARLEDFE